MLDLKDWFWLCFLTKHLVCDYFLQMWPWQYKNKGTYGHPGGLVHSGIHGLGTFIIVMIFNPAAFPFVVALFDFIVHYHIDWGKMNINRKMGWLPNNSENFWLLLGVDQYLHGLTYFLIIVYCMSVHG